MTTRLISSPLSTPLSVVVLTFCPLSSISRISVYMCASTGEENSLASGSASAASSGSRYKSLITPSSATAEAGFSYLMPFSAG